MASSAAFTTNDFPQGKTDSLNAREIFGKIKITVGDTVYPATGIPISFASSLPYSNNPFYFGRAYGTAGYTYVLDPVNQSIRIFIVTSASTSPLTEVSATPAGTATDTIYARVIVQRT